MAVDEKGNDTAMANAQGIASTNIPAATRGGANSKKGDAKQRKVKRKINKPADKGQAYMYLGPNLPGGILFTGGVYKKLPEHLGGVFEKAPEVKKLFVEITGVPAFKAELSRQGSEPYRLRQSVERLISEGALNNVL